MTHQRTLKPLILKLLGEEFPLRVHDIREHIKWQHKLVFTTQAIHKMLNKLITEKVITKYNKKYQLSHNYILELDDHVRILKQNYFLKKKETFVIPKGEKQTFNVTTLSELDKLWNDILLEKLQNIPKGKIIYAQHAPHAWFNLVQMGEEIKILDTLLSTCKHFYTLVNGNTKLDTWIGKFYKGKKFSYALRENPIQKERTHQYAVLDSYIFEAFYPKELGRRLDNVFTSSKEITKLNVAELLSIAHTPADITLTLENNKQKAKKREQQILTAF